MSRLVTLSEILRPRDRDDPTRRSPTMGLVWKKTPGRKSETPHPPLPTRTPIAGCKEPSAVLQNSLRSHGRSEVCQASAEHSRRAHNKRSGALSPGSGGSVRRALEGSERRGDGISSRAGTHRCVLTFHANARRDDWTVRAMSRELNLAHSNTLSCCRCACSSHE